MSESLKIAVAGLGTVGAETLRLIHEHGTLIAARCGRPIAVAGVSARDRSKPRPVEVSSLPWFVDAVAMAADPEIDVVIEVIGGAEGVAKAVIESAIGARHGPDERPLEGRKRVGPGEAVRRRPFDAVEFPFHDLFERYAVEAETGARMGRERPPCNDAGASFPGGASFPERSRSFDCRPRRSA